MDESLTFVHLLWVQVTRAREQQLLQALRAAPGFQDVELTEWDLTQTWFRAALPAQDHVLEAAIDVLLSIEGFSVEIQGAMHGPILAVVFNAVPGRTTRPRRIRPQYDRRLLPAEAPMLVSPAWAAPLQPRQALLAAQPDAAGAAALPAPQPQDQHPPGRGAAAPAPLVVPEAPPETEPAERPRPAARYSRILLGLGIAFHVIVLISLFTGWLNVFHNDAVRRHQAADFFSVYQGAAHIWAGVSPYSPEGVVPRVPYFFEYRYLPSVGYTFVAPLLLFSPWPAYWLWIIVLELLLVFNIIFTRQMTRDPSRANIATAMWLLFSPLYVELYMGQFSFAMGSMFFWMAYGIWRGKSRMPWAAWIASVLLKTNSILFAPSFFRRGLMGILAACAVVVLVLNLPHFARIPSDARELADRNGGIGSGFYTPMSHAGGMGVQALAAVVGYSVEQRYEDDHASWLNLKPPPPNEPVDARRRALLTLTWSAVIAALAATFFVKRFDLWVNLTVWMLAYFVIFPDVWEHHYSMLLPMLVLLYLHRPRLAIPVILTWAFVAAPSLHVFIDTPLRIFEPAGYVPVDTFDPQTYWPAWASILYHTTKAVPVYVLFWYLVWWSFRDGAVQPFRLFNRQIFAVVRFYQGRIAGTLAGRLPAQDRWSPGRLVDLADRGLAKALSALYRRAAAARARKPGGSDAGADPSHAGAGRP